MLRTASILFAIAVSSGVTFAPRVALADDWVTDDGDEPEAKPREDGDVDRTSRRRRGRERPAGEDDLDGEEPKDNEDNVRFRGGVVGSAGFFWGGVAASSGGEEVSLENIIGVAGADGHIGIQFVDLVGLYWVPSFDIIFGEVGGVMVGSSLVVDFTIADHFFVGVGPGVSVGAGLGFSETDFTVFGTAAPVVHLRLGGYPVVGDGEGGRRKGLAIAADVRVHVYPWGAGIQPMLSIGYEAF